MHTSDHARPTGRILLAAMLLVALATVGSVAASPPKADAWAWDSNVLLQGRAACGVGQLSSVYISASNGEGGYASLGSGTVKRSYSFQFRRVPTSTVTVTATARCSGSSASTKFGLNRPSSGTSATRNLCFLWAGVCAI